MMPSIGEAILALSVKGDLKLKSSKPTTGYLIYLWRMIRFHSAIDPCMPITCFWDLQNELDKEFGEDVVKVSGRINTQGKEILDKLDKMVDELCITFKLNPFAGALRWRGLLY